MKLFNKTLLGTAAAMLLASTAQASPITVGGVTWDPDSPLDFSSFSIAIRQFINPINGVVSGFGFISTMNGDGQSTFCPGCELTFQFGGYTPVSSGAIPTAPGQVVGYQNGWVNVYVDTTPEITNPSNPLTLTSANTGDGTLWLGLTGHNQPIAFGGTSFTGTVNGIGTQITSLTGSGLLDAASGLAKDNFDTNTQFDGADFSFSNSFTLFLPLTPGGRASILNAAGTGNFFSNSIPEPGSLTLIGLGLLGAGVLRRIRSK